MFYGQPNIVYPLRLDKVLEDLPSQKMQKKFWETMEQFTKQPGDHGLNFESLHGQNLFSIRIQGKYRVILYRDPKDNNTYMPVYAGNHDEAYAWSTFHCVVDPKTSAIVYHVVKKENEATLPQPSGNDIFCNVKDEDMHALGVPDYVISEVRKFTQLEDFYGMKNEISEGLYDILDFLLEGCTVDEVKDMLGITDCAADKDTTILQAAQSAANQQHYKVVTNDAELHEAMEASLEKWRVFLHPTQRKVVERNYNGSARVVGVAGTGKTVVAMHRAKFLAAQMQPGEKLLFTTFTKNLAVDIEKNLRKICSEEEMAHIEVKNLDGWAASYLSNRKIMMQVSGQEHLDKVWRKAIDKVLRRGENVPFPEPEFYREEWRQVIMALKSTSPDEARKEYALRAKREGRKYRLDRKQRLEVWSVMDEYRQMTRKEKMFDYDAIRYECRRYVSEEEQPLYKHVIVDEGQDFSMCGYRLLRTLAGKEHPNDIFIVGDAHQRIYDNRPILSHCGIYIKGNSTILRVNYRTTEEIHTRALGLLHGFSFDEMDNNAELSSELLDERTASLTHGKQPVLRKCNDIEQEHDFIIKEAGKLTRGNVDSKDICVVARGKDQLRKLKKSLQKAAVSCYELDANGDDGDDRKQSGIRLATMHRVKGLEFEYMFLIDLNKGLVPLTKRLKDAENEQEALKAEKCLLYVAMTRARKGVYLLSSDVPSPFIDE